MVARAAWGRKGQRYRSRTITHAACESLSLSFSSNNSILYWYPLFSLFPPSRGNQRWTSCQNLLQVVNVAEGMSLGPPLYMWSHRLTNTDVVSVVTTTRPYTKTTTAARNAATSGLDGEDGITVSSSTRDGGSSRSEPPFRGSFGRLEGVDGCITWQLSRISCTELGDPSLVGVMQMKRRNCLA